MGSVKRNYTPEAYNIQVSKFTEDEFNIFYLMAAGLWRGYHYRQFPNNSVLNILYFITGVKYG